MPSHSIRTSDSHTLTGSAVPRQGNLTWEWTDNNSFILASVEMISALFMVFPQQFAEHELTNPDEQRIWSLLHCLLLQRRHGVIDNTTLREFRSAVAWHRNLAGRGSETDEFRGGFDRVLLLLLKLCPPCIVQHRQQWYKQCSMRPPCKFCAYKPSKNDWQTHTHLYIPRQLGIRSAQL